MKYAILQSSLEIPDVEKLKRAFRSTATLTDLDAHILANDAFGILVKGKSAIDAQTVASALAAEGIATEVVEERFLPELPQAKFVRKLECTPEALILHDPLGRPFPLPWEHIMMIAAGNVKLQHFDRKEITRRQTRFTANGDPYYVDQTDVSTKEESRYTLLLEIIISRAMLRYSVTVDKAVLFQSLGSAFKPELAESFGTLVRQLLQYGSNVAVNRGAYYMGENALDVFSYPSKNAFYEEIVWLLWRMNQASR